MESKINHLERVDDTLAGIIHSIQLPPVHSTHNVFNDLMSCIIEQQIHYRSTKKTFQKQLAKAGMTHLRIEDFDAFETKSLSSLPLSLAKQTTILSTVDFFENNSLDWHLLGDDEVRKQLKTIKGIGNWTIDMILLYTLNRENIFPIDDYHLKLAFQRAYGLKEDKSLKTQMIQISQKWEPECSLGVLYLLEWKKQHK